LTLPNGLGDNFQNEVLWCYLQVRQNFMNLSLGARRRKNIKRSGDPWSLL